jgi:hypothetical protein
MLAGTIEIMSRFSPLMGGGGSSVPAGCSPREVSGGGAESLICDIADGSLSPGALRRALCENRMPLGF